MLFPISLLLLCEILSYFGVRLVVCRVYPFLVLFLEAVAQVVVLELPGLHQHFGEPLRELRPPCVYQIPGKVEQQGVFVAYERLHPGQYYLALPCVKLPRHAVPLGYAQRLAYLRRNGGYKRRVLRVAHALPYLCELYLDVVILPFLSSHAITQYIMHRISLYIFLILLW